MLFSTPTQFAVCALLLVAGWLFGLASHPGGRKWKERYAAERDAHAASRKDWEAQHKLARAEADERIAATKVDVDDRDVAHRNRIAELERENDRLRSAAPVTAQTIAPRVQTAPRPIYTDGRKRGWFDFS